MSANLIPISSDGGFISGGDISTTGYASPAPSINGFSSASFTGSVISGNLLLNNGIIQGGIHTVVDDGINSIALTYGAQMDVYGFPFDTVPTRGRLTISGDISTTEAIGTWYYQATNTNSYQLYTDNTYAGLVDATAWTPYTGGGTVSITKNIPAANVSIDSNGFLTKFTNNGEVTFPSNIVIAGNAEFNGNLVGSGASPAPSINGFDSADFVGNISANYFIGNGEQLTGVATKTTGNWTLAPGVNTVSFTVDPNGSYTMWVNGNIPNGIVTWNATVTTSNQNVPVVGSQYGWYYTAGNALVLTSMPNQIVGTSGTISTANSYVGTTSNVFTFGITNNSGTNQVVDWGYITL